MISKSIQESNKQFFVKNTKAKMLLQKLNQTEKQIQMLFTKRTIQITELFSMIKQMEFYMTNTEIKKQKITFLYNEKYVDKLDEYAVRLGVNRTQLIAKSLDEYVYFLDHQFQQNNTHVVQYFFGTIHFELSYFFLFPKKSYTNSYTSGY